MVTTHNLGFPRIGARRELKRALESYWSGKTSAQDLQACAAQLRQRHWQQQSGLGLIPVGDFSLYDHVLDMSATLGNLPQRVRGFHGTPLDNYFRVARGKAVHLDDAHAACCGGVRAGEMTKWLDTNYHYIVPELNAATEFALDGTRLQEQLGEACSLGLNAKPVIIGPVSYLWLGKADDGSDKLALLERLLPVYRALLAQLAAQGADWVQIDEPVLVTELDTRWREAVTTSYTALAGSPVKLLLASYFGHLLDNLPLVCDLPVHGLHIDAVNARDDVEQAVARAKDKVLSVGIVNGRNVWKNDLTASLDWLEPLHQTLGERLWIAPSCSLLHVPVDLRSEQLGAAQPWLAFAAQKLDEVALLARALDHGRNAVRDELAANHADISARRNSLRVRDPAGLPPQMTRRASAHAQRAQQQHESLRLPLLPTTTIGSFPQTAQIRQARSQLRSGTSSHDEYVSVMRAQIEHCVREQESLGLDVLVHGEPERNDMVEYFGEQLAGYVVTAQAWVQSYGSRCVKPPILCGDVTRPQPMTLEWTRYAQSLTAKPMKGMLTGPVTLLNWSFVRDDQPRALTCRQLALALRQEVLDLEHAGIRVIQIDEPALREGLPLRKAHWPEYLQWAVECFRISSSGVADATQIHTHMCYSEFNDIIAAIAELDADVITIETSRSNMELLTAFEAFTYPNQLGPGVYDIHSPNLPSAEHMVELLRRAARHIPAERLWVNPDCGLKTRTWEEVRPALRNMVAAARQLRTGISG